MAKQPGSESAESKWRWIVFLDQILLHLAGDTSLRTIKSAMALLMLLALPFIIFPSAIASAKVSGSIESCIPADTAEVAR